MPATRIVSCYNKANYPVLRRHNALFRFCISGVRMVRAFTHFSIYSKSGPSVPTFRVLGVGMPEQGHKKSVENQARALAEPLVSGEGMELIDVEFVHERGDWVLRLFIDKPGGVGLEDCTQVSRTVGTALDVEDLIDRAYHLEVSSPGLNRPLKNPEHFRRAEGRKVRVKTYAPIGEPPRRNFAGVLKRVNEDAVMVEVPGAGDFRIPFGEIAKANLEFES
jgi:ribosome maturation factor RimP